MLWQCFQGLYRFYRMITIVSTQPNLISVHERQQPGSGDVSLCDSTLLLLLSRVSEFLKYFICSWQWVSICYLIALSVSWVWVVRLKRASVYVSLSLSIHSDQNTSIFGGARIKILSYCPSQFILWVFLFSLIQSEMSWRLWSWHLIKKRWIQNANIPKCTITNASDKGRQMIRPGWVWYS